MVWKKEYLDLILVPTGLLIMLCYHLFLLYRYLRHPETTVIGNENHCRKAWVERMLQVDAKDRDSDIPQEHVEKAVISGGLFWTLGLRAIYFATTLLLWIFGPIPMFVCSVTMVLVLHRLDSNSTPLHQFRPVGRRDNMIRKFDEEKHRIERANEQHEERSHMHGSTTQEPPEPSTRLDSEATS
ncbi:hypothetical protein ACFX2J_007633 [Malus domestica]